MNLRKTRLAGAIHSAARTGLPDSAYLWMMAKLLPLVDSRRRGHRCRITKEGDSIFRVFDLDSGSSLYFCEPVRVVRYLHPGNVDRVLRMIHLRYEQGPVRVMPGDVVVDLGANIGEFSAPASRITKRVVAVEPDPKPFECLLRNSNLYPGIQPINALVAETRGPATFYLCSATADSSMIEPDEPYTTVQLQAYPLDELLAEHTDVEQIDFLKVEAEGAEPEVLKGAMSTLSRVQKVAVDAGPERKGETTIEPVRDLLEEAGFQVSVAGKMVFGYRTR